MINNLIPSRNDILSLQTESYDTMNNNNYTNRRDSCKGDTYIIKSK